MLSTTDMNESIRDSYGKGSNPDPNTDYVPVLSHMAPLYLAAQQAHSYYMVYPPVYEETSTTHPPPSSHSHHSPKSRRSFTVQEKVQVLQFIASGKSVQEACQTFQLHKSMIYKWKEQEHVLLKQTKKHAVKKMGSGRKLIHPEIEALVVEFIKEMQSQKCVLKVSDVQKKALDIAQDQGNQEFKASYSWISGLLKRHSLIL